MKFHDGEVQYLVFNTDEDEGLVRHLRELNKRGCTNNMIFYENLTCFVKKLSQANVDLFRALYDIPLGSHVYIVQVVHDFKA